MVALQYMVVMGVWAGTAKPACGSSDQCYQAGTFCALGFSDADRCDFCGGSDDNDENDPPLPPQTDPATGGTLNDPSAPDFVGFNLTAVAELCADPSLPAGGWHNAVSVVSWCKSRNDALAFSFP